MLGDTHEMHHSWMSKYITKKSGEFVKTIGNKYAGGWKVPFQDQASPSANEMLVTEWETLMKERKAKQRATEEVSELHYELNTLWRNIDLEYIKKEMHEQQTVQV